jgi:hypothetical protein
MQGLLTIAVVSLWRSTSAITSVTVQWVAKALYSWLYLYPLRNRGGIMANTFELIASYTATGSVASIDFSSIPSTYTDLIVKFSARASAAYVYQNMFINFNGATTNQTQTVLWVDGATSTTTPYSLSDTRIYGTSLNMASATSNTFSNYEFYIPNYAGSTYKSLSTQPPIYME